MSPARFDERVSRGQVELFFQRSEASVAASVLFATAASLAMPTEASGGRLSSWFALVSLTAVARLVLGRLFLEGRRPEWPLAWWRAVAIIGSFVSGLWWGLFMMLIAPEWGSATYPVAVFLYGMVPALSLVANGPLFAAYLALIGPMMLPHAVELVMSANAGRAQLLAGFGSFLYLGILSATAREVSRQIAAGLRASFANLDLIARLEASNAELAAEVRRREETENSLREATKVAETANKAKSTFLARVSHEVRTPLNGILGITDILKTTPLSKDQAEHAATIEEAGKSLLRVINDILDISKSEAGTLSLRREDFSVSSVIERVVVLLRPGAEAQGLTIDVEVRPDVPGIVNGDPGRLRQVLINLIGNALKFTTVGGVRVVVSLLQGGNDAHPLLFEVIDTGCGIALEEQGRLFQPFAQAGHAHDPRREGAGLGLVITKHIVDLMEGRVGVESEPGRGSRFWFTARFRPATGQEARPEPPASREAPGRLRGHILLVDDNAVNRTVCASFLRRIGCTFVEAIDGAEAERIALQGGFDAILMDCEMPQVDGYEATRRIRAYERGTGARTTPIIAVTASALPEDRERTLSCGMTDHLSKPFSVVDLYSALRPHLTPAE